MVCRYMGFSHDPLGVYHVIERRVKRCWSQRTLKKERVGRHETQREEPNFKAPPQPVTSEFRSKINESYVGFLVMIKKVRQNGRRPKLKATSPLSCLAASADILMCLKKVNVGSISSETWLILGKSIYKSLEFGAFCGHMVRSPTLSRFYRKLLT